MKIAVIGTGSVGGTIGRRLAELGHSVSFGVRNVLDADAKALIGTIKGSARLAGVADAAKDAEVVVLATPYAANAAAIAAAGNLSGKILIDVTNPIGPDFSLATGFTTSGAEEVAKLAPRAKVFKAMNQVARVMIPPARQWSSNLSHRWALRRSTQVNSRSHDCSSPMPCCGFISWRAAIRGAILHSHCCGAEHSAYGKHKFYDHGEI